MSSILGTESGRNDNSAYASYSANLTPNIVSGLATAYSAYRGVKNHWENFNRGLGFIEGVVEQSASKAWGDFNRGSSILKQSALQGIAGGAYTLDQLGHAGAEGLIELNHNYKSISGKASEFLGSAVSYVGGALGVVGELGKANNGLEYLRDLQLQNWATKDNNFGYQPETLRNNYEAISSYASPNKLISRANKVAGPLSGFESSSNVLDTFEKEYRAGNLLFPNTMKQIGQTVFTGSVSTFAGAAAAVGTAALVGTSALAFAPLIVGGLVGYGTASFVNNLFK